ncbi:hypothetical protein GCM10027060_25270 [Nesterenkonia halophila]|uniref:DoxX family protein n=1 Tax=Nesterenkonia halophila TaxID=302044 RepID=UPI001290A488|nr:DoxX family protein [Nesterenkonia halophila]
MRNHFSTDLGLLLLRLAAGILFIMSGLRRVTWLGVNGSRDYAVDLGLPFAQQVGAALPFVEIIGGALLIIGLLTRFSAAVLTVVCGAAAVVLGREATSTSALLDQGEPMLLLVGGTLEFSVLLAVIALVLACTGGGAMSVDAPAWRSIRRR